LFQSVEVGWNGCAETYPDKKIVGCWGQMEGGYGDGFGEAKTGGNWVFRNSYFHHNVQDGLDLLYADGTGSITVQQTHAEGNAGNQIKLSGNSTVENSLIVGNCSYFDGIDYMSGNNSGGANTAGDQCRALGNALVVSLLPNLHATIRYNTIVSEGDCLMLAINGDGTSGVAVQNNVLLGKPNWLKGNSSPQPQSCLFFWDRGPTSNWPVTYAGNIIYQVKDNNCPPGAGNQCNVDPKLTDENIDAFNPAPLAGSPLISAAMTTASMVPTDLHSRPRPSLHGGYDVGALQYQGAQSAACADTIFKADFSATQGACQ
jgi:hypothetical protein